MKKLLALVLIALAMTACENEIEVQSGKPTTGPSSERPIEKTPSGDIINEVLPPDYY